MTESDKLGIGSMQVRWRPVLLGALAGAVLTSALIWIPARGHVRDATFGDGELYRYVAQHLTSPREAVTPLLAPRGLSIRYGRIGLPALLWLFSLGKPSVMFWVQPLLMTVAGALAGAATVCLLNGPPLFAMVPFLSLAFSMSVAGGFAEGMSVALILLSLVFVQREEWIPASLAMSAAILTKESAFVVLMGTVAWLVLKRSWKGLWISSAAIPYIVWGVYVRQRYGFFPLTDPWLKDKTVGTIGVSLYKSFAAGGNGALAAGLHALLAVVAIALLMRTRSFFSVVAVIGSIPVFATAPVVWHYVGDGFRSAVFQEVFVVLALINAVRSSHQAPGPA